MENKRDANCSVTQIAALSFCWEAHTGTGYVKMHLLKKVRTSRRRQDVPRTHTHTHTTGEASTPKTFHLFISLPLLPPSFSADNLR